MLWSSKKGICPNKEHRVLSPIYTVWVPCVWPASPPLTVMVMRKDQQTGFLWCLSPLTEPEYMKTFSAVKTPESIHHGQGTQKQAYAVLVGLNYGFPMQPVSLHCLGGP